MVKILCNFLERFITYAVLLISSQLVFAENESSGKNFRYYCEHVAQLKVEDGACEWATQIFLILNDRREDAKKTYWGNKFPAIDVPDELAFHVKSLNLKVIGIQDFNEFGCVMAIGKYKKKYKRIDFIGYKDRKFFSVKIGKNYIIKDLDGLPDDYSLQTFFSTDLLFECDLALSDNDRKITGPYLRE